MAAKLNKPANTTEKLMKNLGSEFQKLKQLMLVSGVETDGSPKLRGSEVIYTLFEENYGLFYPSGGSVCPQLILTENSMTVYVFFNRILIFN
jgi:hypothetical protein